MPKMTAGARVRMPGTLPPPAVTDDDVSEYLTGSISEISHVPSLPAVNIRNAPSAMPRRPRARGSPPPPDPLPPAARVGTELPRLPRDVWHWSDAEAAAFLRDLRVFAPRPRRLRCCCAPA